MPHFVVVVERGDAWDWSLPLRRQQQWEEHATFMDALVEEGFILAGGPLGDEDRASRILHVIYGANEEAIRSRLATDPWAGSMLKVASVEPWTILLGGVGAAR
jgi:uncharacterized protein YciI